MSRSLILSLNSASAKYSRLSKKVRKSITKGEFFRYTQRKRNHLIARIERLKRRISELQMQMKLAGAGIAAGLLMTASGAYAQKGDPNPPLTTPVGPWVFAPEKNPLPPPPFYWQNLPVMTYWDMDADGDLDAIQSYTGKYPNFYRNIGTKQKPFFQYIDNTYDLGLDNVTWFGSYSNSGRVVTADIDNDGDQDLIIGMAYSDHNDPYGPADDQMYFYRNVGTPQTPQFQFEGAYADITVQRNSWPAFGDYDKDGDLDLAVYGQYEDTYNDATAYIQFFRNDSPAGFKGDPTYKLLSAPNNPLYLDYIDGHTSIAFADLDKDGDDDFFWNDNGGLHYKRNDNGVFNEQIGVYKYAANGASTGNPLDISGLDLATADMYRSFAFADLDGDGDLDLSMPTNNQGTLVPKTFYIENTGNGVMKVITDNSNPMVGFEAGDDATSSFLDFDKDGDLDILATGTMVISHGETSDNVAGHVLFRNDNMKFTPVGLANDPFALMPTMLSSGSFRAVDVDGDGDFDFVATAPVDNYSSYMEVKYFRNDNGKFVDTKIDGTNPMAFLGGLRGLDVAFADLDGDGLLDLVHTKYSTHMFAYKNTGTRGNPKYEARPEWESGFNYNSYEKPSPRFVDIDNDGDMDLTYGKYGNIWLYQNIGDKTAPKWKEYQEYNSSNPETLNNPFAFIHSNGGQPAPSFMDFDGDGDKDLLFGTSYDGTFEYYENQNPAPTITNTVTAPIPFVPKVAITLDSNMDLTDSDGDKIVRVTAELSPFVAGQEKLQLSSSVPLITAVWADSTATLYLTGAPTATYSDYASAMKKIQYIFTGPPSGREGKNNKNNGAGKLVQKTITVNALDSDYTIGTPNTATYVIAGDDGTSGSASPVISTSEKAAAAGGNVAISLDQLVTDADGDLDLTTLQVTSQAGAKVIIGNGIVTIDYSGISNFTGKDVITVAVCDSGGRCANTTFNVEVGADALIFTGMSPNGDGVNDIFTIQYLPNNTHVAIYNRWGEAIFETGDYDVNEPSQRFEGKNKNGTEVVAGSYFYKIKFPDGRVKTGYLLLNR